jgi:DNA-binding MarR family transcriptional regulator
MTDEDKPKRRTLPILEEDPSDWGAAVVYTLVRVYSRMERRMSEVVGGHRMTLAQFDVLATLCNREGITQQQLADELLVTKGNVVGLIDRLCAADLLERRADPSDRRANLLFLTRKGKKRLAQAFPSVDADRSKLLSVFSKTELQQLHRLLRRLEDSTEA